MDNIQNTPTKKEQKPTPNYLPWLFVCSITFIIIMVLVSQWIIFKDKPAEDLNLQSPDIETTSTQNDESDDNENLEEDSEPQEKWHTITIQKRDTLEKIFNKLGVSIALNPLINISLETKQLKSLKPGKELKILLKDKKFKQLSLPLNAGKLLEVTFDGKKYRTKVIQKKINSRTRVAHATIRRSIYTDAKRAQISAKLVKQLIKIFKSEIDFVKDLRPGDKFSIVYEEHYVEDEKIGTDNILAATFINQGETYTAIRFTDSQGHTGYYTPNGTSLNKALLRFPVKFSHISSPFSTHRLHPIIRVIRPHRGVDFAAALGSPVTAAGNGQIVQIGENASYGKFIKIKHNQTHHTLYAHMLRFNKGLQKGLSVKQGQVIGFIGQSGLARGAHLHYEVHLNGKPVNPMTTHLPMEKALSKVNLAKFKAQSHAMLAQLKVVQTTQLASK